MRDRWSKGTGDCSHLFENIQDPRIRGVICVEPLEASKQTVETGRKRAPILESCRRTVSTETRGRFSPNLFPTDDPKEAG